jgi:hypothetical protein
VRLGPCPGLWEDCLAVHKFRVNRFPGSCITDFVRPAQIDRATPSGYAATRPNAYETLVLTIVLAFGAAAPVFAHHLSPAEPDISDMMGMHDAAIEAMLYRRAMDRNLGDVRSDNVGANIGGNDSVLEAVGGGGN